MVDQPDHLDNFKIKMKMKNANVAGVDRRSRHVQVRPGVLIHGLGAHPKVLLLLLRYFCNFEGGLGQV